MATTASTSTVCCRPLLKQRTNQARLLPKSKQPFNSALALLVIGTRRLSRSQSVTSLKLPRLTRRSNTRRRSKRPRDSTDNNPARSKYYIWPPANESHYWRSKHRRSRQAEVHKPQQRRAKRSL